MRPIKEIEYSFFGCLFDNAPVSILEAVELRCKKEWFTLEECRLVWVAIENINKAGGLDNFSLPIVWQESARLTRKKKDEFSGVSFNPTQFYEDAVHFRSEDTDDLSALAGVLRNGLISRSVKELAQKDLLSLDSTSDSAAVVTSFVGKLTALVNDEAVSKDIDTSDLVEHAMSDFKTSYVERTEKKNYDYTGPGFQTPWQYINKAIGNFEVGLNIVAARPSVGKTSFALQLINYWNQCGYKCAFNCLDMSCNEIIKRPMVSLAQLNLSRAKLGMLTQDEFQRLKVAARTIKDWGQKGILRFRMDYDVDEFIAWCKIQKKMNKLDIVVIDYVQQLKIRGFEGNENALLQAISTRLKELALTYNIPIILLAQLNRATVSGKDGPREPEISDIRGSGALEQDAFTVTLLHRDDDSRDALRSGMGDVGLKIVPDSSDPKEMAHVLQSLDTIWVIRKKSQNGASGRFPMVVYNSSFQWFLGDPDAAKADKPMPFNFNKFSVLSADYRFNQEPFLTAERNGMAKFPDYWEPTAERICKRMGWEVPESLKQKISAFNNSRMQQTSVDFSDDRPPAQSEPSAYSDNDEDEDADDIPF